MKRPDPEDTAPEGMQLYNITGIGKDEAPDGRWCVLEASADDGTWIFLGFHEDGTYEVLVGDPVRGDRRYFGAPAKERFEKYLSLYKALESERLTDPSRVADT